MYLWQRSHRTQLQIWKYWSHLSFQSKRVCATHERRLARGFYSTNSDVTRHVVDISRSYCGFNYNNYRSIINRIITDLVRSFTIHYKILDNTNMRHSVYSMKNGKVLMLWTNYCNSRHLLNYSKLNRNNFTHSILVFVVITGILAQLNKFVLVVCSEYHLSYAQFMCKVFILSAVGGMDRPSHISGVL